MIQALGNEPIQQQAALKAALEGVAICDRSHWGRIAITDSDRLSFLHNQSTNHIKGLQPGQGCETVIITSTARTIDLVSVYCQPDSLLLLVSPNRCDPLMQWFDRYIFFQDKVQLHNQTETTGTFSLIGPQSEALLAKLGWAIPSVQHGHEAIAFQDHSITIARGSGLASEGFTLIFDRDIAKALWSALTQAGAIALGDSSWETLRIQQGRPKADAELTEDFNPLEAGLWHLISLDKGCYIGQETIARLNTYNGVKQNLWGLVLPEPIEVGEPITLNEKKVGVVTSCIQTSSGGVGLGYVKSKAGQAGSTVQIAGMGVTLREVPFLTRAIATE